MAMSLKTSGFNFGEEIREWRKKKHITQKALAAKIGLADSSYMSHLERGDRDAISRKLVDRIARALELEPPEQVRFQIGCGLVPQELVIVLKDEQILDLFSKYYDILTNQGLSEEQKIMIKEDTKAVAALLMRILKRLG